MKIFGIIRKVDGLGRIVLPTELRRAVNMKAGAEVQIELQGNKIVLTPVEFSCALCGSAEHLIPFEDDHNGILLEIEQLGEKFDFLIGVCDSQTWLSMCDFLSI